MFLNSCAIKNIQIENQTVALFRGIQNVPFAEKTNQMKILVPLLSRYAVPHPR